nr:GvpL/GvpF family gas vesicle protein [Acidobacteriota bacterium]
VVLAIAGAREAARAGVEAVAVRTIAAVIEHRKSAPRVSETGLARQLAALGRLEKRGLTILPVRYGTVAQSEAEIRSLLAPQAAALKSALAIVRGRRQMTIRVRGTRAPGRPATGAAYLASRVAAAHIPEADLLRRAVSAFVVEERVDPPSRQGFLGTVFHLIGADDVARYKDAASALPETSHLMISGPMIPFAFAPPLDGSAT